MQRAPHSRRKLLLTAAADVAVATQIHNATDDNVIKLSGKLRPFVRQLDLWHSTTDSSIWTRFLRWVALRLVAGKGLVKVLKL